MRRTGVAVLITISLAGCGSASTSSSPTVTPSPTPTLVPTPTPSPTPTASPDPFAGLPFSMDLPPGWISFDLANPANKAAMDAVIEANPDLGPVIQAFESNPNVRMSVDLQSGTFLIGLYLPTEGASLTGMAQELGAGLASTPGVVSKPVPESVTLPIGDAVHWLLSVSGNSPGGGTYTVDESVYLVANAQTAVIIEFVALSGGTRADESSILQTLHFTP